MTKLVIVESPSKSKTIEKYLGSDYKVVSSKGHIRDLATSGKDGLGVDTENGFTAKYKISKDKKDVVASLKKQTEKADFVYLATDPDREGEAISWHLADELGIDINQDNRVVFNEITKNAVLDAMENPRSIDMQLVESQETRRILDRIIGFKLSKLLQRKISSKSAGRVQSIALRLICDREKEIEAFKSEEYWLAKALFKQADIEISAELDKYKGKKVKLKNEEEAKSIKELANKVESYRLAEIKKVNKIRKTVEPFITSSLQQEASTKLGFNSKRTMAIAQSLYEGVALRNDTQGLITYMRTDSYRLSNEFVYNATKMIEEKYGKEYVGHYKPHKDENSQDAHEAIRPTSLENTPESVKPFLTSEQYKLYKFIYYRTIASLMANAKTEQTTYYINGDDLSFKTNGSILVFDGFLKVYKDYDGSKNTILPKAEEGSEFELGELSLEQFFTEPPTRYTEAKLIGALKDEGVGRPSTYATIIDTIIKRAYVEFKKATEKGKVKYFYPTEQGKITDDLLKEHFANIIDIKYTANMEKDLDKIAMGDKHKIDILEDFFKEFTKTYEKADSHIEKKAPEKVGRLCPECGGELVYRQSRFGKFVSCGNFPKCKYTESLKAKKEEPIKTDKICPECGGVMLKRKSRYGTYFLGCSNYPKCKHLEKIEKEENNEG